MSDPIKTPQEFAERRIPKGSPLLEKLPQRVRDILIEASYTLQPSDLVGVIGIASISLAERYENDEVPFTNNAEGTKEVVELALKINAVCQRMKREDKERSKPSPETPPN